MWSYNHTSELYHHGIKGMKWGKRRFQNKDGSLTPAGKKRYSSDLDRAGKAADTAEASKAALKSAKKAYSKAYSEYSKAFYKADSYNIAGLSPVKKHREANDRRWEDAYDKAVAANKAESDYKAAKKQYKIDKALAKMEYKEFVKTRSKEILAGESFAGKVLDVLTDAHKYQAQIEYNLRDKD